MVKSSRATKTKRIGILMAGGDGTEPVPLEKKWLANVKPCRPIINGFKPRAAWEPVWEIEALNERNLADEN